VDTLEADKKAVVKVCNRIRKMAGLGATSRLKRGVRCHSRSCTVAMTLAGTGIISVRSDRVILGRSTVRLWETIPGVSSDDLLVLRRFIRHFDAGRYPELEIPKSEIKVGGKVIA
jgi:hypothetical protein